MWSKSSNGSRSLNRSLNRRLNRPLDRHSTRMLNGARRPRPSDSLSEITKPLTEYLRIAKRMAEREPTLFGPNATKYFLETLRGAEERRERDDAMTKVYGARLPGEQSIVAHYWASRYPMFAREAEQEIRKTDRF